MGRDYVVRDKDGNVKSYKDTKTGKTIYTPQSEVVELTRTSSGGGSDYTDTQTRNGVVESTTRSAGYHRRNRSSRSNAPTSQTPQNQAQQTAQYIGTQEEQEIRARLQQRETARQNLAFAKARMNKATASGNYKQALYIYENEVRPANKQIFLSIFPNENEVSKKGNELIDYVGSKLTSAKTRDKYAHLVGEKETVDLSRNVMTGEITETRTTPRKEKSDILKSEISQNIKDKDYSSMAKNVLKKDLITGKDYSIHFLKSVVSTTAEIPKSSAQLGVAVASLGVDLVHEPQKYTAKYVGAGAVAMGGKIIQGARDDPVGFMGSMAAFSLADKGLKTIVSLPKTLQNKAITGSMINKSGHTMQDTGVKTITTKSTPQLTAGSYATSSSKGAVLVEKLGTRQFDKALNLNGVVLKKGTYDIYSVGGEFVSKSGKTTIKTQGGYLAYVGKDGKTFISHTIGKSQTEVLTFAGRKPNFKAIGSTDNFNLKLANNQKKYMQSVYNNDIYSVGVSKTQPQSIIKATVTKPKTLKITSLDQKIPINRGKIKLTRINKGDSAGVTMNLNAPRVVDKLNDFGSLTKTKGLGLSVSKNNLKVEMQQLSSRATTGAKTKATVIIRSAIQQTTDKATGTVIKTAQKTDKGLISSLVDPLQKSHTSMLKNIPKISTKTQAELLTPTKQNTNNVISASVSVNQKANIKSVSGLTASQTMSKTSTTQATSKQLYQMSPTETRQKQEMKIGTLSTFKYEQTQAQTQKQQQSQIVTTRQGQRQRQDTKIKIFDEIINPIIDVRPEKIIKPIIRPPIKPPVEDWKFKKFGFGFGGDSEKSFKRSKPTFSFQSFKRERKTRALYGWGEVARFESITGKKALQPKNTKEEKDKFKKHLRRGGIIEDYKMPFMKSLSKKKRFSL